LYGLVLQSSGVRGTRKIVYKNISRKEASLLRPPLREAHVFIVTRWNERSNPARGGYKWERLGRSSPQNLRKKLYSTWFFTIRKTAFAI